MSQPLQQERSVHVDNYSAALGKAAPLLWAKEGAVLQLHSLFYPLLRACGLLQLITGLKYPHHEKRSMTLTEIRSIPSISSMWASPWSYEGSTPCHSLNKTQHQLENPCMMQVLYLQQTNRANPHKQNKKTKNKLKPKKREKKILSKEGCQHGIYWVNTCLLMYFLTTHNKWICSFPNSLQLSSFLCGQSGPLSACLAQYLI